MTVNWQVLSFVLTLYFWKKNISWARWGEEEEETKGSKQTPTTLPSLKTNIYVEHFGTRPLIDEGLVPKRRKLDTSAGVYLKL